MLLHKMEAIRLGYGLTARILTPGRNERLFLQMSSGFLGPTQPPSGRCVTLTFRLHLTPRLRIIGAIAPLRLNEVGRQKFTSYVLFI